MLPQTTLLVASVHASTWEALCMWLFFSPPVLRLIGNV